MNQPTDNEQVWDEWDAQIVADLKAGKLDALIEAARDEAEDADALIEAASEEAEDAYAVNKPIEDTVMTHAIKTVGVLLGNFNEGIFVRATCDPDVPDELAELNLAFNLLNEQQPGQWELVTKRANGQLGLQHVEFGKDDCDPVVGPLVMDKPTDKKLFFGKANGGEANDLAQATMDQANLGMATRMFSKPGDMDSVALLTLTYQVLEANSPGYWHLRPTENFGVCLVSANWEDDA